MFKERTQSNIEWRRHYEDLKGRLDLALNSGQHELAARLDGELEEFLDNAEAYLSEVEEGNLNEDKENEQSSGHHYTEELPPLYEEYLWAKKGEYITGRFLDDKISLENQLAYNTLRILDDASVNINFSDFLVPDGTSEKVRIYQGPLKDIVREFKNEVKPEKVQELVDFCRAVWEDKVSLLKKLNPNWPGFYNYFGEK
jgi:hypothetical protein